MSRALTRCIAYPFGEGKSLLKAAKEDNLAKVMDISRDAEVSELNYQDQMGYTSLHYAAEGGNRGVAESLLRHNADPNIQENFNFTPLMLASQNDHDLVVSLLIDHKANVNDETLPCSALHYTAHEGHHKTADVLIKRGANINAKDDFGRTPLHMACQQGKKKMVKQLLKHSADVNARTEQGFAPIHTARKKGYDDIVQILKKTAKIQSPNGKAPRDVEFPSTPKSYTPASEVRNSSDDDDMFIQSIRSQSNSSNEMKEDPLGGGDIGSSSANSSTSSKNHPLASSSSSNNSSGGGGGSGGGGISLARGPRPMFRTHGKIKNEPPKPKNNNHYKKKSGIITEVIDDEKSAQNGTHKKRKSKRQKSRTHPVGQENEFSSSSNFDPLGASEDSHDERRPSFHKTLQDERRDSVAKEEQQLEKRAKQLEERRKRREEKEKRFEAERLKRNSMKIVNMPEESRFFRVIDPEAICYRYSPALNDRVSPPDGPKHNDVIEAITVRRNWVQAKKWKMASSLHRN